jgi:hypothetical protein
MTLELPPGSLPGRLHHLPPRAPAAQANPSTSCCLLLGSQPYPAGTLLALQERPTGCLLWILAEGYFGLHYSGQEKVKLALELWLSYHRFERWLSCPLILHLRALSSLLCLVSLNMTLCLGSFRFAL